MNGCMEESLHCCTSFFHILGGLYLVCVFRDAGQIFNRFSAQYVHQMHMNFPYSASLNVPVMSRWLQL